jgi:hypothetical protein
LEALGIPAKDRPQVALVSRAGHVIEQPAAPLVTLRARWISVGGSAMNSIGHAFEQSLQA